MILEIKEKKFGLRLNMGALSEIRKSLGKGLVQWMQTCNDEQDIDAEQFCKIIAIASKWSGSNDVSLDWLMENLDAHEIPNVMECLASTMNNGKDISTEDQKNNPL